MLFFSPVEKQRDIAACRAAASLRRKRRLDAPERRCGYSAMDENRRFGMTTTEIPLLRRDGRLRFARPKPVHVRLLEWTVATLWVFVTGVAIAAVL
jgi:hypothetical protein